MDFELKKKALRQLARSEGSIAEQALAKESERIARVLSDRSMFDELKDSLTLLGVISYRIPEYTVDILRAFLERTANMSITHKDVLGISETELQRYQSKSSLVILALDVLREIRYHQPDAIFDILIAHTADEDDNIAEAAGKALEKLAEYNIDVFYAKDQWPGLGARPQIKVLEKIENLDAASKEKNFPTILRLCSQVLSPTMHATSSDFQTFTWKTSAVPAVDDIIRVRNQSLNMLFELFKNSTQLERKLAAINCMHNATRSPSNVQYSDETLQMITYSTAEVLRFWAAVVSEAELEVRQKIEHHAYWTNYHNQSEEVQQAALEIKTLLDNDDEYQIFKILVGFEGVFGDWNTPDRTSAREIREQGEYRDSKAKELAKSVAEDNFETWQSRIVCYASIKSNDMATFPVFGKFLEYLGAENPEIAIKLISNNASELERFFVPIFCGIWTTDLRNAAQDILESWVTDSLYLSPIARIFEFNRDPGNPLIPMILDAARDKADNNAVIRIMAVVSANFDDQTGNLIEALFLPALRWLTDRHDARWVFDFWYRKQIRDLIASMASDGYHLVMENLLALEKVDYHAEEILYPIAEADPKAVIQFFISRVRLKRIRKESTNYEAIPFDFQKLSEPLSQVPEQVVDFAFTLYDDDYGMFVFGGARIVNIIFPEMPDRLEARLIEYVRSKEERKILFCMAILRNYEGEVFTHGICKEIVNALPADSKFLTEVEIILESTGVVTGEFGMANAYQSKRREVASWLDDSSDKVRQFARRYISSLEKLEKAERSRATEEIELRKQKYGSDTD